MRLSLSLLLFLLFCVPVLAYAPSCVLKVRITSPTDGYFAPAVADGVSNMKVDVNVFNASSNSLIAAPCTLKLDNGTMLSMNALNLGNYSVSFGDYREGTHTFTVNSSLAGCIDDSISQYYFYRKGVVRSAPDFNPLLAPLVAVALIMVARIHQKKKAKK